MNLRACILTRQRREHVAPRPVRLLRNVLVTCFWLLDVAILFYAVENWRGARRFAEAKHRLEQRGASLDWKSFAPAPVPDDQNVAMHPFLRPLCQYEEIRTPHPKGGWNRDIRWLDSNGLSRIGNVRLPYGDTGTNSHTITDLARWQTCFRRDTNFPSPAQPGVAAHDVLLALSRFDVELGELHEALSRPYCRFPLHYDDRPAEMLLRHLSHLRGLAEVLRLRAVARMAAGDEETALSDTEDIFRMADVLKEEPVLTSFLVRMAILHMGCNAISEGLARGSWSEEQLVGLQAWLARQDLLGGLELAMKGETAGAIQTLETIRIDGGFEFRECGQGGRGRQFFSLSWAPRGWFDQNRTTVAEYMYQYAMPSFNPPERRVYPAIASAEVAQGKSSLSAYSILAIQILPWREGALRRAGYAQTKCDQTLLACALERHRLCTGRFPESLAALAPEYLATVPHDVVTGSPLGYRLSPDGGFLLWSAGWNELDEGGLVKRTRNGHLNIEEGDWVWERQVLRSHDASAGAELAKF